MPLFAIAFLMGDLYLQTYAQLPSRLYIVTLFTAGFLCWIGLAKYGRYRYFIFALGCGFSWSAWYAQSLLSWNLPKELEGRPVLVTGYVSSLPTQDSFGMRFTFRLQPSKTLIRLSWRDKNQILRVGEKRQFLVRLKRLHSTQSPQAFDFEAWALHSGLRATGYVLTSRDNILLAHEWYRYPIHQIRQKLQDRIKEHLPHSPTAPWLMALTIGERNGILQEDWQVLRNTGTNHLMAIAGLHIGMMAGLGLTFVSWLWRRFPRLVLLRPASEVGACAALVIAVFYSLLAGFSIPTQRACIMLAIFITALLTRRKIHVWHSWSLALLIVLLLNPLSVLSESLWLSFGTIALIIYGMSGRLSPKGWWWKWFRVQWVVGLGLTPLTLALFQQSSLISFLANSIAIPWLGFLILPFCFLSTVFLFVSPSIGGHLLWLADKSLSWLWMVLAYLSKLSFSTWYAAIPNSVTLILAVIGFLLLLLPAGFSGKWLGFFGLLPLFFYQPEKPVHGDFWVSLLDVGQGLAVVVQTQSHTLVYDTGPKFGTSFDMGESIVLPYLRTISVKHLDMLVISHGDNDHIGGSQALLRNISVSLIKTSTPEKIASSKTNYCHAGEAWQWDGVRFSFIYPGAAHFNLGNDSSCVLRIDNGVHSVLLTGDIEKYAENHLLAHHARLLPATMLVAPHHGSKTSGLPNFIKAVKPRYVLYPTGYRNRYHFPHHGVVEAYKAIGAIQLNTVETGTMLFKLKRSEHIVDADFHRIKHKRYWMD